jgi:hypothetical protein
MLDFEIMGPQIEIERIFSLAKILMNLKICRLQIGNLDKLIFTRKNWPNDPRVGCFSPSKSMIEIESPVNEISFCTCNL